MTSFQHEDEPHGEGLRSRLNWLRAAVLGANDGIVSVAGMVMGVAGATTDNKTIFIAGLAGLVAGALSMAAGEYVSVSTQRDTEKALLAKEARELREDPQDELRELTGLLMEKGISEETARAAATEMTEHDALAAHAEVELGLDPDDLTNAWAAAFASMIAFTVGALIPLLVITLSSPGIRVEATGVAVVVALVLTGALSAWVGEANIPRAVLRNVGGGVLAMVITYWIGSLVGTGV